MKNVISILFAIAMLAITGAAQSQITIESLAVPGLVHDNNASSLLDPSIVASKSHMKFIGSFNPSSSGGCSFPHPQSCRDMRIAFDFGSGLTVGQMISVSTTELRVITPNVPSNGTYPLHIQRNYGGVWVTEIYEATAISVALDDDFVVLNPAQYVLNMLVTFQN